MGKKKSQQHVQQSMGSLVSKAALAQMGPQIQRYIDVTVKNMGSQIATQQASTLGTIFARLVALESIIIEKLGISAEELSLKVATLEDQKEGLDVVDDVARLGDVVRVEVATRAKDQAEFQGQTRLKIHNVGSGETIGEELELALLGTKAGDVKELEFGENKDMVAKFTVDRVSRPVVQPKSEEATNANDSAQG